MASVEILAPANSPGMARALIRAGADIIYCGLKGWSLRPDMFEMDFEDIDRTIRIALDKGKKIYLAFNCFYRSGEIPQAMELINEFAKKGISGVIISQVGLIGLVRKALPQLPIQVSVQSSASSLVDVDYYRHLGVSGVVLPRNHEDLDIENIKALTGRGIAIEVFILGDDSTNYDGRCALSGYFYQKQVPGTFGREKLVLGNANRCGYCFLACKGKCSTGESHGHLLRHGDLALYRQIPQLIEAGVGIFKVQGREFPIPLMKRIIATLRLMLNNVDNSKKFNELCLQMDQLVGLKNRIARNHLWLLNQSRSPFWKGIRPIIEKPWDAVTTAFYLSGIMEEPAGGETP